MFKVLQFLSSLMKAVRGLLLTVDPSVKQILLALDESLHFIIEHLDNDKLFIDPSFISLVTSKLDAVLEENTYRAEDR